VGSIPTYSRQMHGAGILNDTGPFCVNKLIQEDDFVLKDRYKLPLVGVLVGVVALALTHLGNPANMGFCIACFLRDMAGSLGLHRAAVVQYMRPEVIGIVLGAFVISVLKKDFSVKGGSAPFSRFLLGFSVMIGALIFLGCPLRMLLRIGGGDLNAVVGLAGFVSGIGVGVVFLNKGFSLKRNYSLTKTEGYLFPAVNAGFLLLLVVVPSVLIFSESGPGSMRAPIWAALAAGLIVGVVGQRVRLCFVSGIRDSILFREFGMLTLFIALTATVAVGNILSNKFVLSFANQPVAHTESVWNFLGLFLVGLGSVLLGGCPYRQLVLAGSGNSDSAVTVLGLLVGAAFAHNFGLASSGAGTTPAGRIAFVICLIITLTIGLANLNKSSASA
jgi:YedE family putative selenium metabolism protein